MYIPNFGLMLERKTIFFFNETVKEISLPDDQISAGLNDSWLQQNESAVLCSHFSDVFPCFLLEESNTKHRSLYVGFNPYLGQDCLSDR